MNKKKIIIYSTLLLLIDQISKLIVANNINLNSDIEIIKSFFSLTYVRNTGAAWGMFSNNQILISIISIIFFAYLIIYIYNNKVKYMEMISFSLIIGGLIGNLLDRLIRNYVIDFLSFNIFGYDFPVFNLADIFIVSGVFILIANTFINDRERKKS